MGFLDGLGRMLKGEPVFQDEDAGKDGDVRSGDDFDEQPPEQVARPRDTTALVDENGYKYVPRIVFESVKTRRQGTSMTVTAWATNTSEVRVRLDYLYVRGHKRVLQRELSPGEGREVIVYDGSVFMDDYDRDARLTFRIMDNDDLFESKYYIGYGKELDGGQLIDELRNEEMTRDI